MEEITSSYLNYVALNHESRINKIKEQIKSMQSLALIQNEERTDVQLSIYYLIKHKYKVVLKKKNNKAYYQVRYIEHLSILSNVHKNSPAVKALFNGYSYNVGISVLFRLCIALCLTFEESYDWFRMWGYELNCNSHKWRIIANLLAKYTANPQCDLCTIREKIEKSNMESISNGGPSLNPKKNSNK